MAIENWTGNIAEITTLYPFAGSEFVLWIIGMVLWIAWHFMQSGVENAQYEEEKRRFGSKESLKK